MPGTVRVDRRWLRTAAPLAAVGLWIAATAPFSVRLTVWGLAVLAATAAAIRWGLPTSSPFSVRKRAVDVAVLAAFALGFAYLAATTRLG